MASIIQLTLRQAWENWGDYDPTTVYLWGYSIRWWGKFGMILQFVSGLSMALDIIGERGFAKFLRIVSSPIRSDDSNVAVNRAQAIGCILWVLVIGLPLGFIIAVAWQRQPSFETLKMTILYLIPFLLFGSLFVDFFVIICSDLFYRASRVPRRRRRYLTIHRCLRLLFFSLFVIGSHFSILAA